jgi:hypothetical protein
LGFSLIVLCMCAYVAINPHRGNLYIHFVLQAQSWLDGRTSIPMPQYQDVQPILDANGDPTGRGTIPFPPLPALVLLPFVAMWHLGTNQQLLSAIFAAVDVGIAYWMLGFLPIDRRVRWLTALFLGLGTVLWYTAAIGSTWFWAHVVAVGCLLGAVGFALSGDPQAAEPRPLAEALPAARPSEWPGGWRTAGVIVAVGALGALLFILAGAGTAAGAVAAVGVLLAAGAALLAMAVAGRRGVVVPLVVGVLVVGGLPAVLLIGVNSPGALAAIDGVVLVGVVVLAIVGRARPEGLDRSMAAFAETVARPETRQIAAGLLFGLACTARLTIVFGFPFLLLVGGGGTWLRRGMLAGAGAAVPLVALLVYTYAGTGHLFNPAYNYLYQNELAYAAYGLPYNAAWSIEDIRYIPQNLGIMLFSTPHFFPTLKGVFPGFGDPVCTTTQVRSLFSVECPLALPDSQGTSILLTSPAYLLAPLAFIPARLRRLDRATAGAAVAVIAIAGVNLMHFSQGWVQFGYRFSNDFVPFALILVALGAARINKLPLVVALIGLSIAVNFWGTAMGVALGW